MASYRGRALALLKGPMLLMLMLSPRRWRSRAGSGIWLCCSANLARRSARGRSRTTCADAASPSWPDIRIARNDAIADARCGLFSATTRIARLVEPPRCLENGSRDVRVLPEVVVFQLQLQEDSDMEDCSRKLAPAGRLDAQADGGRRDDERPRPLSALRQRPRIGVHRWCVAS